MINVASNCAASSRAPGAYSNFCAAEKKTSTVPVTRDATTGRSIANVSGITYPNDS